MGIEARCERLTLMLLKTVDTQSPVLRDRSELSGKGFEKFASLGEERSAMSACAAKVLKMGARRRALIGHRKDPSLRTIENEGTLGD